jgi:hypothetical protein
MIVCSLTQATQQEKTMQTIPYDQFAAVELRVGTVTRVEPFPATRKPAYKLWADFGPEFGVKQTSVQITVHYTPETLIESRWSAASISAARISAVSCPNFYAPAFPMPMARLY